MENRTLTLLGLVGVVSIAVLAAIGIYSFVSSYLLESAGELLTPTLAAIVLTVLVVGALSVLGARSRRWMQNPYW
ncbi:hypothetical protein [Halopiger goleimassiliensis]|uniref:hypothetical protein n=1 Tax=Halopiger goleimassiliensis TaxID=1293048 RepID=UPI000678163F|nr:hypothetical protein [Halopiger goleimassiliensis]